MKILPEIKRKDESSLEGFIADSCVFVGLRHFEAAKDDERENYYGVVNCLWSLTNKLDEDDILYLQLLLTMESEDDLNKVRANPFNMCNYTEEEKETKIKPILKDMKNGENAFQTTFRFSLAENKKYYKFDVRYYDNKTKTGVVRTVQVLEDIYYQISKTIYWLIIGAQFSLTTILPVVINPKAPIAHRNIIGLMHDEAASSPDVPNSLPTTMAHFILYYTEGIHTDHIGITIPIANDKKRLAKHNITFDSYYERYGQDPVLYPDSIFAVFTPETKYCFAQLSSTNDLNIIYEIDSETAKRVDWLLWDKHVYYESKEDQTE